MKYLIYSLFFAASGPDTNPELPTYNPAHTIEHVEQEISFWTDRLETSPYTGSYRLRLAQSYESHFQATGEINSLTTAEYHYRSCVYTGSLDNTPALLSLAQNLITQHRFCEAYEAVLHAERIGRDLDKVRLVRYDIEHELGIGQPLEPEQLDIQHLIRLAKESDADGDLTQAIVYMMQARETAYDINNTKLQIWTTTNLAEFMGHNGNIATSEELLQEVLDQDPGNWYAYKLLAWISYAHYGDVDRAISMIDEIMRHRQSPELFLFKAELLESIGLNGKPYEDLFLAQASEAKYDRLYHMDVAELLLRRGWEERAKGLAIMKREYAQRKTPETAAMLAFAYAQNGGIINAREIFINEVYQKTFEPVPHALMLEVMKEYKSYHNYLEEQLEGIEFELGPIRAKQINEWLG